ncbi:hypothetical protein H5410_014676 [Solanum commersonii]|uniref:Uncharacterized protein n=1 Tax=Solanum commersonii TaxID=4109 RepID=A0A9J5ZS45_SOLCO|nr:hypothetical protein H5410_014676 [Solanum commersonii]
MQRNPEPPAVQIKTAQKIDPTHFLFFLALTKKCQSSSNGGIPGKATASALTNSFQSYQPRLIALVATRWQHVKHKEDWDESKPSTLLPFGFSGILDEISYKTQLFSGPGEDFQFGICGEFRFYPPSHLNFRPSTPKRTPIFPIYINPFYFTVKGGRKKKFEGKYGKKD